MRYAYRDMSVVEQAASPLPDYSYRRCRYCKGLLWHLQTGRTETETAGQEDFMPLCMNCMRVLEDWQIETVHVSFD